MLKNDYICYQRYLKGNYLTVGKNKTWIQMYVCELCEAPETLTGFAKPPGYLISTVHV